MASHMHLIRNAMQKKSSKRIFHEHRRFGIAKIILPVPGLGFELRKDTKDIT